MAIQNETVLKKMKAELQYAEANASQANIMKKHIANIQLLCDLLLDEETVQPNKETPTEQEMKAMLGATTNAKQAHNQKVMQSLPKSDDDTHNGDSIFDF